MMNPKEEARLKDLCTQIEERCKSMENLESSLSSDEIMLRAAPSFLKPEYFGRVRAHKIVLHRRLQAIGRQDEVMTPELNPKQRDEYLLINN